MTYLRVLVGAFFLLAVIGAVVSIPFGPGPVLAAAEKADLLDINTATGDELKALPGIGDAHSEKSSRVVRTSGRMSWCRRRFFREQLTRGSNTRLWLSRNSLFYAARIRFSGIDCPTLRAI
jgi:hypothetical protein